MSQVTIESRKLNEIKRSDLAPWLQYLRNMKTNKHENVFASCKKCQSYIRLGAQLNQEMAYAATTRKLHNQAMRKLCAGRNASRWSSKVRLAEHARKEKNHEKAYVFNVISGIC